MPLDVIKAKRAPYRRHGKPWHRPALQNLDDYDIVPTFGAEYRGIVGYYLLATDVWRLGDLRWHAKTSMLKTLAAKHQSTVSKMAAKHKAKIETRYGLRTCFEARIHRDGKPDLVARFGGIPLVRDKDAVLLDRVPKPAPHPRKELIHRLLTRRCELCGEPGKVLVHQVRKLASLGTGRARPTRVGGAHGDQATQDPRGLRRLPRRSSTPTPSRTRHRSLESHVPGNGPAWFGGGPRGKGASTTESHLAARPILSTSTPAPDRSSTRSRWIGPGEAAVRTRTATRWTHHATSGPGCIGRRCRPGCRAASRTRSSTRSSPGWARTGTGRWWRSTSPPGRGRASCCRSPRAGPTRGAG